MFRATATVLSCAILSACASPQIQTANPAQTSIAAFAQNHLNTLQARSFAEGREYCGYFLRDSTGRLQATPPRRGTSTGCRMSAPGRNSGVFASYHTHGAFGPNYDREVPSPLDLRADFALGLDGYIATPGGRVWHINHTTQDALQICGIGCVTADPRFQPGRAPAVAQRYTITTLAQRGLA